jgi:hypothetical protein
MPQKARPSPTSRALLTAATHWGGRWDLNPRHPGPQPGALPTELRPPWPPSKRGAACRSIQARTQFSEPDSGVSLDAPAGGVTGAELAASGALPVTLAAISRAVAVSGPGIGTKTASR